MTASTDYPKVFNRLCHMAALSKQGNTQAVVDNLVATIFAVDSKLAPTTHLEVARALNTYFSLSLGETEVRSAIDRLVGRGRLLRDRASRVLVLAPEVKAEVEKRIVDASDLERNVHDEWLASIEEVGQPKPQDWNQQLWASLRSYMAKAFRRHGAETILLLNPALPLTDENRASLGTYLEEAVRDHCSAELHELAFKSIRDFFINNTPSRTKYVAQLLDGTFTFFALTVDQATAAYLRSNITPLKLFLDTNFIFGILDLHSNPLSDISHELVEVIKKERLPFTLYYHQTTLEELRRTIWALGSQLREQKGWRQETSRAALRNGNFNALELQYHEKNAESPLDVQVFLSKYEHVETLLAEFDFRIFRSRASTTELDEERFRLVAEYKEYIESRQPQRPRLYEALNHDMTVWQTVKSLHNGNSPALNAGAFLLTIDYYLYGFDWQCLRQQNTIGSVLLPNSFLQLLRPFVSADEDLDQKFIEVFSIPEFRTSGGLHTETYSKVLSYINTYAGMSEETATRILADEIALQQLQEVREGTEEYQAIIESAAVRSAEQALEEKEALQREKELLQQQHGVLRTQVQEANDRATLTEVRATQTEEALRRTQEESASLRSDAERLKQEASEVIERLTRLEQDALTKTNAYESDIGRLGRELTQARRSAFMSRLIFGLAVGLISMGAAVLRHLFIPWQWLDEHPDKLGIYVYYIVIVSGVVWAIVDGSTIRRSIAFTAAVLSSVIGLAQILGR